MFLQRTPFVSGAILPRYIGPANPLLTPCLLLLVSVSAGTASISPGLTTLTFYPGFGAINDELYEEYLKHTVLSGLAATGE